MTTGLGGWGSGEQVASAKYGEVPHMLVKFDAELRGPLDVRIVDYPRKRKPPHWNHRAAVVVALVSLALVLGVVLYALATASANTIYG
jgi:hypothetical protein